MNFKMSKKTRIITSGILAVIGYALMKFMGYAWPTVVIMIAGTIIAGLPIFQKAFSAARYKIVGIDALVTIAVIGALFLGEYWEAAAVTFLFMLGDYLESRTIDKTRSAIKALVDMAPDEATVRRDGEDIVVAAEDIVSGDVVVVKPGEKIAVDGEVLSGQAYVNQAAITGESVPVSRSAGEGVFSGTVLESGYLLVRADRVGDDTTFSRIIEMVEEAQDKKAKSQKFLEKFSRWYTPAIIVLAAVLYFFTRDIRLSLTLLVIACPGALVISTPVSIVAGIGNGARNGVLIKGGDVMEKLGQAKVVAFDKTGTLTVGHPEVTAIHSFGTSEDELLRIAAAGEAYSEHPLARAILKRYEATGAELHRADDAEMITGRGVRFDFEGKIYYIGNERLMNENGIDTKPYASLIGRESDQGRALVLVADEQDFLGVFGIADVLRPDAVSMIKRLRGLGVRKLVMLTGDNKRTAAAVAAELGLDDFYADLLPEDKVAAIEDLRNKYGTVAMIGDGVNDAPALAASDLGMTLDGAGSDVALETADVVLMSNSLEKLIYAVGLSRSTARNIKQNVIFAVAVALTLLAGVLVQTVDMSFGMLIHETSVLLVVLNAVRLSRYGRKKNLKARPVQVSAETV